MSDGIIVALVSFAATVLTNIGGYRLIAYRVEQLEKKQEKYNNMQERMANRERHSDVQDEKICVANHRISDLEEEVKRLGA